MADFYQLEAKRLELGEHTVESSLIGEHTRQDGVPALRPGPQGRERGPGHIAQVPADPDLVAPLSMPPRLIAPHTAHVFTAHTVAGSDRSRR